VIAAEGDHVAASRRANNPRGNRQRLAAAASQAHLLGPRVNLDQLSRQRHLVWRVERAHRAALHPLDDRRCHAWMRVTQQTRPDAIVREIEIPPAIDVNDFAPLGLGIVGWPLVRRKHLRPLAEELRTAGDDASG
jgi:hypothetical protein